jgi:hypothetical protein
MHAYSEVGYYWLVVSFSLMTAGTPSVAHRHDCLQVKYVELNSIPITTNPDVGNVLEV